MAFSSEDAYNHMRKMQKGWSTTFCKMRQRGVKDSRVCCKYSVICKLLYKVTRSIAFRRLFLIKISQVNPPFPLISVTWAKDTLLVGHLEELCPYITRRLNVDLVE